MPAVLQDDISAGFEEWDVTNWSRIKPQHEQPGRVQKLWLKSPHEAPDRRAGSWLMKWVTISQPSRGDPYVKGDDWAERIACAVAEILRIPTARTELAIRESQFAPDSRGIVSRSFLDEGKDERLVHGSELMSSPGSTGEVRDTPYTLDAVWNSLHNVAGAGHPQSGLSAPACFASYLLLDALIGNTDRHSENWGVIEDGQGDRRIAPSFDHASCLGFLLTDDERKRRLETRDTGFAVETWAKRGRSWFVGRRRLVDLAVEALNRLSPNEQSHWIDTCLAVDMEELVRAIVAIPEHRMSGPGRRFAERVLRHNIAALSQCLTTLS